MDSQDWDDCVAGNPFQACKGFLSSECSWFQVACNFVSNELFEGDGPVSLESLETREWCGESALLGADDEAGDSEPPSPTWSDHRVVFDPIQTTALVEWTSTSWDSHAVLGSFEGGAGYRIDACAAGGGDCVILNRLVVYGGDIEINGVLVSNMVIRLRKPVELVGAGDGRIEIPVGGLPMLLTSRVAGHWIAWEVANGNDTWGSVDPEVDAFSLDTLEFEGSQGDIRVSVELDIGGSHP